MVDRSTLFGIVQIGALLHRDKADVSRSAARGDYGKAIVAKGSKTKRYTLAGLEKAAGKKFSPEQVALAAAAHDQQTPSRPALLLDFASALLALRDFQWHTHLEIAGIEYPPFTATNPKG